MKNIVIFTGHYGSGKTEIAINYAIKKSDAGFKTAICDMDIVNPYFRTKDAEYILKKHHITVITPEFANTNLDLPSLPSSINSLFDGEYDYVIFDVGGDADGAVALGAYKSRIEKNGYKMNIVVNLKRPLTQTKEEIIDMTKNISSASRLTATGFINNTNLSYETTPDTLLWHQDELELAAQSLGIPILYKTGTKNVISALPADQKAGAKEISIYLTPQWLS